MVDKIFVATESSVVIDIFVFLEEAPPLVTDGSEGMILPDAEGHEAYARSTVHQMQRNGRRVS